jgi:hypothetical protein
MLDLRGVTASASAQTSSSLAGNINIAAGSIDVVDTIMSPMALGMSPLALGDDQVAPAIDLGFSFNYNGQDYTNVDISSNGFLTFGNLSGMNSNNLLLRRIAT